MKSVIILKGLGKYLLVSLFFSCYGDIVLSNWPKKLEKLWFFSKKIEMLMINDDVNCGFAKISKNFIHYIA